MATLISLYRPRKADHSGRCVVANVDPFSENILASNETEPILSDSSVDLSLNSSCGRIDRRIPGDMLYSSYMRS
jgi:hypothetical protein